MLKFFSVLALLATITFAGNAQSSWGRAHQEAHQKELANKSSRLDNTFLNTAKQEDIFVRESRGVTGVSRETATLIDDLLNESSTHIGKRYVWGSKGPATFDCSGFTGYVYKQFGYNIGPCSREQYKMGTSVDIKNLRKGDLVFFTSRRSGSSVGHVGIVWEVDNANGTFKFIHASVKGVKISDFEGYYVKRYVGARRVIE